MLVFLCAPMPFLAFAWGSSLPAVSSRIATGLAGREVSLRNATGITDEELHSLRVSLDERDRLLVFFPIDQEPEAVRPALLEMLEPRTQIYRNLLYPRPRDGRMCTSAAEVARAVASAGAADVLLVDLRQTGEELVVEGATLVFEQREGIRVRHWRIAGSGR